MLESKLEAMRKGGRITQEQASQIQKLIPRSDSPFPAFGERIHLMDSAEEAIELARKGRYTLLDLVRSPKDPEEFLFVLKLKEATSPPGRRLGQPRTWLLLGIALGAALSSAVQMLWNPAPPPEQTAPGPVMLYEAPASPDAKKP